MQPNVHNNYSYPQAGVGKPKITWIAGTINTLISVVIGVLFIVNETTEGCSAGIACAIAIPVGGFLFFDVAVLLVLSQMARRLDERAALILFWYSYLKVALLGAYEIYFLALNLAFNNERSVTPDIISVLQLVILPLVFTAIFYIGLQQFRKYKGEAARSKLMLIAFPLLLLPLGVSFRAGYSHGIAGRLQSNTFQSVDSSTWTSHGAGVKDPKS